MAAASCLYIIASFVAVMGVSRNDNCTCKFESIGYILNCSFRGCSSVPNNIHFTFAFTIDLSSNNIKEIKDRTFMNASVLLHLNLSHNEIHTLESLAFFGLKGLKSLQLSDNKFSLNTGIFTPELFAPLTGLEEIRIQRYESPTHLNWRGIDVAFGKLTNLTKLFLDLPKDFIFEEGFRQLSYLTTISTDDSVNNVCSVGTLSNTTFKVFRNTRIKELRLIKCNIVDIESGAFYPLTSLEVLDLTYNSGLGLHKALHSLRSLQNKNMTDIKLVHVNNASCYDSKNFLLGIQDFQYLTNICVQNVDISLNYIGCIDDSLESRFNPLTCLQKLNMSFHSLCCFPKNFLFSLQNSKALDSLDLSHGYGTPESRGYHMSGLPLSNTTTDFQLPPNLSMLNLSSFGMAIYFRLNFTDASRMSYLGAAFTYISNCEEPMILGLENLQQLDITGIPCKKMQAEFFLHFPKIKTLILGRSPNIQWALKSPALPFSSLYELTEINLNHCKLSELNDQLFLNNKKLKTIKFSQNKFQHLTTAVWHLEQLEELDLSYNSISHFREDEMNVLNRWLARRRNNSSSFKLLLMGNPLQCTCETVFFIKWIIDNRKYLDNDGKYLCLLSNGSWVNIITFKKTLADFKVKCISGPYLIISVVGSSTALLVILVFAAVYRYRLNLRYWLYTRLKPPADMFVDQDYSYDAFVAYTSDDYDWVYSNLHFKLENEKNRLKLCIHDRDFIPGKPIHENIVDKIQKSRKILFVISKAFLESTYGPLEIEYAGMKCLEEGRDDVIVCVLMEDIPVGKMPKALRNLWHKITFLKLVSELQDDAIFWRNLTEALGHDKSRN